MTNADAIGAKVYVRADLGGDGKLVTQISEVAASSSFLSMSSLNQHFGLGVANEVAEVTVVWPSGLEQTLYNLPVNTITEIKEPVR